MQFINFIKGQILSLIREEEGQDGVEYLLVVGAVIIPLLVAMVALYAAAPGLVADVCTAISSVDGAGGIEIACPAAA